MTEPSHPRPVPFDPEREDQIDARRLRGIAHPLRLRMLWALRERGPSTATRLAELLGESSGATSYHLRQLAAYGFVVEDTDRGTERERWWRAAKRGSSFDLPPAEDLEGRVLGEEYLHTVATLYSERMQRAISGISTAPPDWLDAATISDVVLRLTPDEARQLIADVFELAGRYRRHDEPDPPAGNRRVAFQFQVLPQEES
ncbi:MAG TPA: helix-turn-helix domain-containing protein [Actinomycetes bacterium]|nr:helix-turn-helix domain-containing protein [Actinomycetes bacterium]